MDWARAVEEVAWAGPSGLGRADLLERLVKLSPEYKLDDITGPMVWDRLCRMEDTEFLDEAGRPTEENRTDRLRVRQELWYEVAMAGKAVRLTENSRQLLELIAAQGPDGILQPDLGKAARMDQRNLHYHLKLLHEWGVIHKVPVSSRKTFTYLCLLSRWVQEEEPLEGAFVLGGRDLKVKPELPGFLRRLTELLEAAPERAQSSLDLFRLSGVACPATNMIRWFRGCIRKLVLLGCIEMILMRPIGGPRYPVYRFIRHFEPGMLTADVAGDGDDEAEGAGEATTAAPLLQPFVSMEEQAREMIEAAGPKGVTLGDIRAALGISSKCVFRIYQRLTERKHIGNSDVVKITEFSGKERRHRLFLQRFLQAHPVQAHATREAGSMSASVATLVASQSSTSQAASQDTLRATSVTKEIRKGLFMEMLRAEDPPVLELTRLVGTELGERLARQGFEGPSAAVYRVDIRTLRRVADQLAQDGLVRLVNVALPSGFERVLVIDAALAEDDPKLATRIRHVKDRSKIYDVTGAGECAEGPTTSTSTPPPAAPTRRRHEHYGFVFGVMLRARLAHEWILSQVRPGETFETPDLLFDRLPLGMFLRVVGVNVASPGLEALIMNLEGHSMALKDLPVPLHAELMRKRGVRMRRFIKNLLDFLTELGLISPVDEGFNRRHNLFIPLTYRVSAVMHVTAPPDGRSVEIIPLTGPNDVMAYWARLQELWHGAQAVSAGLPKAFQLAKSPFSWLPSRPTNLAGRGSGNAERVRQVAQELGMAPGQVEQTLNLRMLKKKRRPIGLETNIRSAAEIRRSAKASKAVQVGDWTDGEKDLLAASFVLLRLITSGALTTLPWGLTAQVLPGRDPAGMRVCIHRLLMAEWASFQRYLDLERRVHYALHQIGLPAERTPEALKAHMDRLMGSLDAVLPTGNGPLRRVWSLHPGSLFLMEEWHRAKHCRPALQDQFQSTPSLIPSGVPAAVVVVPGDQGADLPDDQLDAMAAIKTVMTWPAGRYNATEAGLLLARTPETANRAALDHLIRVGYLNRASQGKHRYRVPGTNLALTVRVSTGLLGPAPESRIDLAEPASLDAALSNSLDLGLLIDGLFDGSLRVAEMVPAEAHGIRASLLPLSINIQGRATDPIWSTSTEALAELMRSTGVWRAPRRTWFWPRAPIDSLHSFHDALFRSALRLVRQVVEEDPGRADEVIARACSPLLTQGEVADCLSVLAALRVCRASDNSYYLV